MLKKIALIWDFDGPIGQINSTLPYNFNADNFKRERERVEWLIEMFTNLDIQATFACTGLSAEEGPEIYHFPELVKRIATSGHELACHGWKHEWVPHLSDEQFRRSIRRSKTVLDPLDTRKNIVGFVPPHNRPMSFFKMGMMSLGDRGPLLGRNHTGDIGGMSKLLEKEGYKWVRTVYKRWYFIGRKINIKTSEIHGVKLIPNHVMGFSKTQLAQIDKILQTQDVVYVSGHPNALNRDGVESEENFRRAIGQWLENGWQFVTVRDSLGV